MIELNVLTSETASAPPSPRGAGRLQDVGDVRRELDDHRQARMLLAPARNHLDILRHLAHRRAHPALGHAVRAAEVEFDAVGAGVLHHRQDALPGLLFAGHHQRHREGAVGPVALDLTDLAQIVGQHAVGDELDVVEADQVACRPQQRAVARAAHIDDRRILAERLPHYTAPPGLVGTVHVVRLVGGRRRRQPERIRRADSNEATGQISHVAPSFVSRCASGGRWSAQRACHARLRPR